MQHILQDAMRKVLDAREANAVPVPFKIGDKLVFKAQTLYGKQKATRIIRDIKTFDGLERPVVKYDGWSDFVVRINEIVEVIPND
tara:strand:- start:257 stop:511 length:255 start_codon:yes stop_codon:yes gene_type:complete